MRLLTEFANESVRCSTGSMIDVEQFPPRSNVRDKNRESQVIGQVSMPITETPHSLQRQLVTDSKQKVSCDNRESDSSLVCSGINTKKITNHRNTWSTNVPARPVEFVGKGWRPVLTTLRALRIAAHEHLFSDTAFRYFQRYSYISCCTKRVTP